MYKKEKITNNANETINLGFELGLLIKGMSAVILLSGDLASGKTTFTKGIARGYGITSIVNSPTYTILKKYVTSDKLHIFYHLDLYRLDGTGYDFDLEEYIYSDSCVVIEWPNQAKDLLPNEYLDINIETLEENRRRFTFKGCGQIYEKVAKTL